MHAYHKVRETLDIKTDRGVRYAVKDDRIIVPQALRQRILRLAHRGHPGIVRMKQKLRCSYWWPAMDAEAESHVRHCIGCQASSKSADKVYAKADKSVPVPEEVWTKIALDITGPFVVAPSNQKYIVAAIDYTLKFAAIHSCTDITSESILRWLDGLFCDFGLPEQIVTDNGRQFTSEKFENFLADRDIQHVRTTPYHPESNGLVERFNGVLKTGIQAFIREGKSWTDDLHRLLVNYRGNSHGTDKKSPGERMFGCAYRQPHQVVPRNIHEPSSPEPSTIEHAQPLVSAAKPSTFKRGTLRRGEEVLLRDLRPSTGKGQAAWRPIPYTIIHRNNKTYTLVRSDGMPRSRLVRHRRDIKRFFEHTMMSLNALFFSAHLQPHSDVRGAIDRNPSGMEVQLIVVDCFSGESINAH